MKASDLRKLSVKELIEKLKNLESELLKTRFESRMGSLSNPLKKREIKRDIARIFTIIKEAESIGKKKN